MSKHQIIVEDSLDYKSPDAGPLLTNMRWSDEPLTVKDVIRVVVVLMFYIGVHLIAAAFAALAVVLFFYGMGFP